MAINDKKFNQDLFTRIFDVWARKTPSYEKHYEQEVIKVISDFGKGTDPSGSGLPAAEQERTYCPSAVSSRE